MYGATDGCFRDFLFAAVHTGLRPFCELAKMTAEDVEETPRGMMWRVYSSKTKKTRKIPVRPEVAELTRRLIAEAPRGSGLPLFRNSRGGAWTRVAGGGAVRGAAAGARLGEGRGAEAVQQLQLPAHVRAPDAERVLERRGGVQRRDAGGADRGHAEGGVRPLRPGVGSALPGPALGRRRGRQAGSRGSGTGLLG